MRSSYLLTTLALAVSLTGCARRDQPRRDESAAHEAGREAYHAGQEIKRDAKKAEKEVRKAGKDFREGWDEGRREQPKRSDK
jgi:hypothetical protein